MTASTPPRDPSLGKRPAGTGPSRTAPRRAPNRPLERARAAARKLLGRDRNKPKQDDPNIYPLF